MCSVKDQSDHLFTQRVKLLDCDQHSALLLSSGTGYDYQFASASSRSTIKFCNTELGGINFEIDSPSEVVEDLDYDVDASSSTLLANMNNCGNSNSDIYLH